MLATDKLTEPVIRYQTDQFRLRAFLAQAVVKMDQGVYVYFGFFDVRICA